jgi:hypothetical protein
MGRFLSRSSCTPVKSAYTRPTRVADIPYVAEYMREEDVAEVQAFSGHTPQESLLHSFFQGNPCMTMIGRDGRPMGMWGVVPQRSDVGAIWMLCTDDLVRDRLNSMRFLREAKTHLDRVQQKYRVLFNFADARNVVHIKWLRWMGSPSSRRIPSSEQRVGCSLSS